MSSIRAEMRAHAPGTPRAHALRDASNAYQGVIIIANYVAGALVDADGSTPPVHPRLDDGARTITTCELVRRPSGVSVRRGRERRPRFAP
jgi:hypothetical protein